MADLTYEAVRRAAGEAVGNLYASVKELRGNVQNMRLDSRSNEIQTRVSNIERILNDLVPQLQRMEFTMQQLDQRSNQQAVWRSRFNMQQFEQRIMNIEQFSNNVSRYLIELQQHLTRLSETGESRVQS